MLARVSTLVPLPFYEPRLELKDEDLEEKEFQLNKGCLNSQS